jgi:hypothetical protein
VVDLDFCQRSDSLIGKTVPIADFFLHQGSFRRPRYTDWRGEQSHLRSASQRLRLGVSAQGRFDDGPGVTGFIIQN